MKQKIALIFILFYFIVGVKNGSTRQQSELKHEGKTFDPRGTTFIQENSQIQEREVTVSITQSSQPISESEEIKREIERVFVEDSETAMRVACCENKGTPICKVFNPEAEGPTDDWGIFQIHYPSHKVPKRFLKNWRINIAIAKQLFDEQGWNPWGASKRCWQK